MARTVWKVMKTPLPQKLSAVQRRHLLNRIDQQNRVFLNDQRQLWGDEKNNEEPAEIKAARKLIAAYEEAEDAKTDEILGRYLRLQNWLKEQILFRSASDALHLVKRYEMLTRTQAQVLGAQMEDRNDDPFLSDFLVGDPHADQPAAP